MKVIFACGGTAGHINPAVSIARRLIREDPNTQVLFVGAKGGMETDLIPREGFPIQTVTISNFHRSVAPADLLHNMKTVMNVARSARQARHILSEFRPDLAVGTGGYAGYPILHAAARKGVKVALHESNAVPGLTTRMLAGEADLIMVGFEESRKFYKNPEKVTVTGTPVREDLFAYTKEEARERLGIRGDRPFLVSFWGSLGAEIMNDYTYELVRLEEKAGFPFYHIHSAGRDAQILTDRLGWKKKGTVEIRDYIYDMPLCLAGADLVLSRSGASTIAELAAIAVPSVLIPSPNVTADHQKKNAGILSDNGGAVLLPEKDCSGEKLFKVCCELTGDRKRMTEMSRKTAVHGNVQAVENICTQLHRLVNDTD